MRNLAGLRHSAIFQNCFSGLGRNSIRRYFMGFNLVRRFSRQSFSRRQLLLFVLTLSALSVLALGRFGAVSSADRVRRLVATDGEISKAAPLKASRKSNNVSTALAPPIIVNSGPDTD